MRGNIIFWKFSNRKGRNRNEGEEERRMKMIVGVFLKIWGEKITVFYISVLSWANS